MVRRSIWLSIGRHRLRRHGEPNVPNDSEAGSASTRRPTAAKWTPARAAFSPAAIGMAFDNAGNLLVPIAARFAAPLGDEWRAVQ